MLPKDYTSRGEVIKFYPLDGPVIFYWKVDTIVKDHPNNGLKEIIGFKQTSPPHKIQIDGNFYDLDQNKNLPNNIQNVLTSSDFSSNCFGYAFFGGALWVEPIYGDIFGKILTIEIIIEDEGYHQIEKPQPGSIALFSQDTKFFHATKTVDGKNWLGKSGISPPCIQLLNDNISKYGQVSYFKKVLS